MEFNNSIDLNKFFLKGKLIHCIANKPYHKTFVWEYKNNKYMVELDTNNFDWTSLEYHLSTQFNDYNQFNGSIRKLSKYETPELYESKRKHVQIVEDNTLYEKLCDFIEKEEISKNYPFNKTKILNTIEKILEKSKGTTFNKKELKDKECDEYFMKQFNKAKALLFNFDNNKFMVALPNPTHIKNNLFDQVDIDEIKDFEKPYETHVNDEIESSKTIFKGLPDEDKDKYVSKIDAMKGTVYSKFMKMKNTRVKYILLPISKTKKYRSMRDLDGDDTEFLKASKSAFCGLINDVYGDTVDCDQILIYATHPTLNNQLYFSTEHMYPNNTFYEKIYKQYQIYNYEEIIYHTTIPDFFKKMSYRYTIEQRYLLIFKKIINKYYIGQINKLLQLLKIDIVIHKSKDIKKKELTSIIDNIIKSSIETNDCKIKELIIKSNILEILDYFSFFNKMSVEKSNIDCAGRINTIKLNKVFNKNMIYLQGYCNVQLINYLQSNRGLLDFNYLYYGKNNQTENINLILNNLNKNELSAEINKNEEQTIETCQNMKMELELSSISIKINKKKIKTKIKEEYNKIKKQFIKLKKYGFDEIEIELFDDVLDYNNIHILFIISYLLSLLKYVLCDVKVLSNSNIEGPLCDPSILKKNENTDINKLDQQNNERINKIKNIYNWLYLIKNNFIIRRFESGMFNETSIFHGFFEGNPQKYNITLEPIPITENIEQFTKSCNYQRLYKTGEKTYFKTKTYMMKYFFMHKCVIEEFTEDIKKMSKIIVPYYDTPEKYQIVKEQFYPNLKGYKTFPNFYIELIKGTYYNIIEKNKKQFDEKYRFITKDKQFMFVANDVSGRWIDKYHLEWFYNEKWKDGIKKDIDLYNDKCPEKNNIDIDIDLFDHTLLFEFSLKLQKIKNKINVQKLINIIEKIKYPYFVAWWIPPNLIDNIDNPDKEFDIIKDDTNLNFLYMFKHCKNNKILQNCYIEGYYFMKTRWGINPYQYECFMHNMNKKGYTILHIHFIHINASQYSGRENNKIKSVEQLAHSLKTIKLSTMTKSDVEYYGKKYKTKIIPTHDIKAYPFIAI
jgi:hypothetical protein